jgi:hypothetical protein
VGLGSIIEGLASAIVMWRFTGTRTLSETAEHRAQKAVAVSVYRLAPYLAMQAVHDLATGHHADSSLIGIAVNSASLLLMPALGLAKHRLGTRLASRATTGDGGSLSERNVPAPSPHSTNPTNHSKQSRWMYGNRFSDRDETPAVCRGTSPLIREWFPARRRAANPGG